MSDEIVKKYVERVLAFRDESNSVELNDEDLKDIARDIGMSDDELRAIDRRINDCAERAIGYMNHRLWDDAIREWDEALAFGPNNLNYKAKLSQCYAERRQGDDLQVAKRLADAVLVRDPSNTTAYEVLRSINPTKPTKPKGFNGVLVLAGGLIVLGTGLGVLFLTASSDPPPVASGTSFPSAFVTELTPPKPVQRKSQDGYPITLNAPAGLNIDVYSSEYKVYEENSFYSLSAEIENKTNREISKMTGTFSYTLEDGNTVQNQIDILSDYQPAMRPGDVRPFTELHKFSKTALKTATLKVEIATSTEAGNYAASQPVELKWAEGIDASRYKLEISERSSSLGTPSDFGQFFNGSWEIKNNGPAIKTLKIEVGYYGKNDQQLKKNSFFVTYSSEPPLAVGATRVESSVQKLDSGMFDHYTLTVIQIE